MKTKRVKIQSSYTAIVRDDMGVFVVKVAIKDERNLYLQIGRGKEAITPCYVIPASYGILPYRPVYEKGSGFTRKEWAKSIQENEEYFELTRNVNRQRLVGYFKQLMLSEMVELYHKL